MTELQAILVARHAVSGTRVRGQGHAVLDGPVRFAFYWRVSTLEFQDPQVSHDWQRLVAEELIAGEGRIVAEYCDIGHIREVPWPLRPQAVALLEAFADPGRPFDAIVFGEFDRGFYGTQFMRLAPLFEQHGVQVWLPGFDGPVDYCDAQDRNLLRQLALRSQLEVQRSRIRATASMRALALREGRFLGGRPPFGYRLADTGPHRNAMHARWGRRQHRLEPDPATAPTVRKIFTMRIAGNSVAHIARNLNESGVPCPSLADRARNGHRSGKAWTVRTVATILDNPHYTGHQVWNLQRTDRIPRPMGGNKFVRRPNRPDQWAISRRIAHPGLVSIDDFQTALAVNTTPMPRDGVRRDYRLTGLLRCALCHRRLDAHWVNHRPGYRCRHGHTSAKPASTDRLPNLYVREDHAMRETVVLLEDLGHQCLTSARLGDYLRHHQMMIICGPGTFSIEPTQSTTAGIPTQRSSTGQANAQ